MKTLISAIVLLALTQPVPPTAAPPAVTPVPTAPQPQPPVLPGPRPTRSTGVSIQAQRPAAELNFARREPGSQSLWEQACATVLVVPAPELTDENLAQITEDMTVMCRILDKVVPATSTTARPVSRSWRAGSYVGMTGSLDDETQTEGLYLGGYGALFFRQVDFPLRAPAAPPEPTAAQEGAMPDPLWSQTVEELQGSPAATSGAPVTAQPYDAAKVENFKTALIRSLRHAANLRLTSAQDFVTLVVSPWDAQIRRPYSVPRAQIYADNSARDPTQAGQDVANAQAEPASVLVLRVRKADADAFAKGQLTAEQFTEKVQLFWSWARRGTTESAAPFRLLRNMPNN
jgi:hypothetical protein